MSKSIDIATILAGIFPGAGHIYLGAIKKGVIFSIIGVVLIITWIFIPRFIPYPYGWTIVAGYWVLQIVKVRRLYKETYIKSKS